jgi:hypothetical protein
MDMGKDMGTDTDKGCRLLPVGKSAPAGRSGLAGRSAPAGKAARRPEQLAVASRSAPEHTAGKERSSPAAES